MRPSYIVALFLALALAGCVGDAVDTGPIDPYATREVAAVHLDPSAAAAALNAYRASHGLGATRLGIAIAKDPRTHYGVYWAMELAAEPRPRSNGPALYISSDAPRP